MRIAVDLDGVLADTMVTFCKILNERYSRQLTVESFVQWNAWEIAKITKDEFFRTLDEAWYRWEAIPPTEANLAEKVSRLRKYGTVDIVTGRSTETVSYASSWLQKHNVPYDGFVRTISTRAKVNLNYDLFIDDSAELMALVASKLNVYGILYSQPWNKDAKKMPRIHRVRQWDEIAVVFETIRSAKT